MNNTTTPLLLSAWSTTTTALERYDYRNRQPYTDSRRRTDKQTRSQYRRGRRAA